MTTITRIASGLAVAALAASASAAPTDDQVTQARADCHQNKERALAMEKQLGPEDPVLRQAYRTWESSCALAQAMMDARDGKPVLQAELPADEDAQTASR